MNDVMRVITPEGTTVEVRSARIASMIRYLVNNVARISTIGKGSLTFNFAGRKALHAEVRDFEDLSSQI